MGNIGSTNVNGRRRTMNGHTHSNHHHHHHHHPPPSPPPSQPPQPELTANRYVFAAATPYPPPPQYPNPNINAHLPYYQYAGYFQPPPTTAPPLPSPYAHLHHHPNWINNRYPSPPVIQQPPPPYVEHQKAVTIRNDVNLKKETLKIIPDDENPGKFLVTFTFDATVPGCITIIYFAKEDQNCTLTPTKQTLQTPIKVNFEKGLGQKYKQPSGTGIDLSIFNQSELSKESETGIYPLAVKAEASPENTRYGGGGGVNNCQITQAVFEKVKGEDIVKVMKQILWVNGMRYELQEIYGIGNSVDGDFDGNDAGKECVICLSEPRDTTVLPCRHMCMCSGCAKVLRFQTNRCPICRQPVERLLEIRVNNTIEE